MPAPRQPLDLKRLKVFPLAERKSMSRIEDILVNPDSPPAAYSGAIRAQVEQCARDIVAARRRSASVMFLYGAHLVKNGGAAIVERLMAGGWLTHLATNGAGAIHDWEFAFQGWSTENVEENVATGTFGTWEETGRNINLAVLVGGLNRDGFGAALGRFIQEDGAIIPDAEQLEQGLREFPSDPLAPPLAELLVAIREYRLKPGRYEVAHRWKQTSIFAQAFRRGIPLTVHPGIGYDIISNHPMFNGAAIGRAAGIDFRIFGGVVE